MKVIILGEFLLYHFDRNTRNNFQNIKLINGILNNFLNRAGEAVLIGGAKTYTGTNNSFIETLEDKRNGNT